MSHQASFRKLVEAVTNLDGMLTELKQIIKYSIEEIADAYSDGSKEKSFDILDRLNKALASTSSGYEIDKAVSEFKFAHASMLDVMVAQGLFPSDRL